MLGGFNVVIFLQETGAKGRESCKTLPKKPTPNNQNRLFESRLENIIDTDHPLIRLAGRIDWPFFEKKLDMGGALHDDLQDFQYSAPVKLDRRFSSSRANAERSGGKAAR